MVKEPATCFTGGVFLVFWIQIQNKLFIILLIIQDYNIYLWPMAWPLLKQGCV